MKVDLIAGRRSPELHGISRYIGEVYGRNRREADFRIIDYRGSRMPGLAGLKGLAAYPFIVKKRRRAGSIVHIGSLLDAHLLNYLDLRPSIVTCHDIFPLLPGEYPLRKRAVLRFSMRGMQKAQAVICDSRFAGDEMARLFGIPEHRVRVIYLGVDHDRYKPLPQDPEKKRQYGFEDGLLTVLNVGLDQPRKNLPVLLEAFRELLRAGMDVRLLKVGRPQREKEGERIRRLVDDLGLGKHVVFTGYVPEDDLPHLYNLSDLFVFPSLYEGFGLPPLEAMACGCPVITSDAASLPEVVGDAAVMVDPRDVEGLAGRMRDALRDPDLREGLRERGLRQAGRFSWDRTARETLDLYREVDERTPA